MTGLWMAVSLALTSVVAGIMLGAAVSSEPLLGTLPADTYVRAKQFVGPRIDPLMPILVIIAVAAQIAGAVLAPAPSSRIPMVLACLATTSIVVISQTVNVPINRWVAHLDPGSLPADFAERDPRRRWQRAHLVRTALALISVLANLIALVRLAG